jgi:hypothetical protein
MKSRSNPDPRMPNSSSSGQAAATNSTYAPSVPISVYRELAAELQTTKAMLDLVNNQNQQLTQQNERLRQEIERVIQSALRLQQVAELSQPTAPQPTLEDEALAEAEKMADQIRTQRSDRPTPGIPAPIPPINSNDPDIKPNELFTEQSESIRPNPKSNPPRDLSGLWLTLIIVTIIVTAFSIGFIVVRPFLPKR